jgi:hypothetical protein
MAAGKQTDNRFLATKLLLRRHFLDKYHKPRPFTVFDACCGEQVIWKTLRKEYAGVEYFGADRVKTKLKVDSARLCEDPAFAAYDVIDIDTYGSPWKHFFNLLPNIKKPTTLFLTSGSSGAFNNMSNVVIRAMGLSELPSIPVSLLSNVNTKYATDYCLAQAEAHGLRYLEIKEALPRQNARYFGVRLVPATT